MANDSLFLAYDCLVKGGEAILHQHSETLLKLTLLPEAFSDIKNGKSQTHNLLYQVN